MDSLRVEPDPPPVFDIGGLPHTCGSGSVEIRRVDQNCPFAFRALESEMPDDVLEEINNVDSTMRTIDPPKFHILDLQVGFLQLFNRLRRLWFFKLRFQTHKHFRSLPFQSDNGKVFSERMIIEQS